MHVDDKPVNFDTEVYAARIVQNAFRRRKLHRITEFVLDKITCTVCGDPGDSFMCKNGHPICRMCLYMRCCATTRHHECCVCRDDKGFYPSPFMKQADLMGLSWTCPDCLKCVPIVEAASHRNICPERQVICPIDGCGKSMRRSALVEHILQHPKRAYTLATVSRVGITHHGGDGDIIVVWPAMDRVIHVHLAMQHTSSAYTDTVWYAVQFHTFGDDFPVCLENVDPINGTVRAVCHIDVVGSENAMSLSPVYARLQAFGYRTNTSVSFGHNGTTSGLPLVERCSVYKQLRNKMFIPSMTSLRRLPGMATVYDATPPTAAVICFALGLCNTC
jgi:ssDNA-binding Zn-finger/Zn-ribbon topoisomerase 1